MLGRRRFLYAIGGAAAIGAGYPLLRAFSDEARPAWRSGPYGPMRPDPAGILDLPEGFAYRIVQRAGARMSDGLRVPARPDGMACFEIDDPAAGGRVLVLMRNHENPAHLGMFGPWTGEVPREAWTEEGMGGVTRVVLDPTTLALRSSNLVLGGTVMNCAGGPSPWGWLSCEEHVGSRRHGYVFVCDPAADRIAPPRVLRAYGRFRHEAACVDPARAIAYLSEDRDESCLYRFVPASPATPFEGELQALAIRGRPGLDTARGLRSGDRLEVAWVPIPEPDPAEDVIRHLARRDGAASFCRGEGLAWDASGRGGVILTATAGGPHGTGQIFRLEPDGDGGELVLIAQSEGAHDFDMPDNAVIAPHTGILFFCEDGHDRNYVRALDGEGRIFDFARNALSLSEIAGVCFSPDGRAMFLNIQDDGLTLAITGPFVA